MKDRFKVNLATPTLRLARKHNQWLQEDKTVKNLLRGSVDTDYKKMIRSWPLNDDAYFGMGFTPQPKTIHVLVELPDQFAQAYSSPRLAGPQVDIDPSALVQFLEGEMRDVGAILSSPHILDEESLQFQLVGREEAIEMVVACFTDIIEMAKSGATDRMKNAIPVCSGISGLGKTRMLEEGGKILRDVMKLDDQRVVSVIVPYYGFNPKPVERLMPIGASFSWRLLYQFFLHGNCAETFQMWFKSRLPVNGAELTFEVAVKAIELKLSQRLENEDSPMYLFVGIDEYQKIKHVKAKQNSSEISVLRELVEVIASALCFQSPSSSSLVVLPMFAGTDWGMIESIANSSHVRTVPLPMNLLTMDQMFESVRANAEYAGLLEYAQVCRDLYTLGGVPKWIVHYLASVKKARGEANTPTLDAINRCFKTVWTDYVKGHWSTLTTKQRIHLAASAIAGQLSSASDMFAGDIKWSKLRDSSLCLLTEREHDRISQGYNVRVPYSLLASVGSLYDLFKATPALTSPSESAFTGSLNDLQVYVDDAMFGVQAWQSSEMFGACFYAVRINSLLVLGRKTVTLKELLPGALMNKEMECTTVKLVPSRIFRSADGFGSSTPQFISEKEHES